MKQNDFDIKQMFVQENDLPEIVLKKKQAAYDTIYEQSVVTETIDCRKNAPKRVA